MKSEDKKNFTIAVKSIFWLHRTTVGPCCHCDHICLTERYEVACSVGCPDQHDSAGRVLSIHIYESPLFSGEGL